MNELAGNAIVAARQRLMSAHRAEAMFGGALHDLSWLPFQPGASACRAGTDIVTLGKAYVRALCEVGPQQATARNNELALEMMMADADACDNFWRKSAQGHGHRVGRLVALMGQRLGLDRHACLRLERAGRLHDIGKTKVPRLVLCKADALDENEMDLIRGHCNFGVQVLSAGYRGPDLELVLGVVRHHHEHFDGSGYPDGSRGNAIPLGARLVAAADAFDAMVHHQEERRRMSIREALGETEKLGGRQLDPTAVDLLAKVVRALGIETEGWDERLLAGPCKPQGRAMTLAPRARFESLA